jgi:hypothetical protein
MQHYLSRALSLSLINSIYIDWTSFTVFHCLSTKISDSILFRTHYDDVHDWLDHWQILVLFNDILTYIHYIVINSRMTVNAESERIWNKLLQYSSSMLKEMNQYKNLSRWLISGPRFKPITSQIQSRGANNSSVTFGKMLGKHKSCLCA